MSQLLKEDTIFEKAMKKYNYFTDNEDLLNEYDKKELYQYDKKIMLADERRIGRKEGIKNEKYSIAKTLKEMNMDDDSISKATGLSIEEIRKL